MPGASFSNAPARAAASAALETRASHVVVAVMWTSIAIAGLAHAWTSRFLVNADGISHIDIAIAIARGDLTQAVNGYWSPAYPVLLGAVFAVVRPSPMMESTVAHGLNLVILLAAMASFHWFWAGLMRLRTNGGGDGASGCRPLGDWAMALIGYGLFAWASLCLVTLSRVGPDLALTACMYLAGGSIVRIRAGRSSLPAASPAGGGALRWYALLGFALGLGYLDKAAMSLMAPLFVASATWAGGGLRRAWRHGLLACTVFALTTGPYIAALSRQVGHLTCGETGRINYAMHVSGYDPGYHWHDESGDNPLFSWRGNLPGLGTARHPKRLLCADPLIEEFARAQAGSYPFWYDPSYWYDGLVPAWNTRGQLAALRQSASTLWGLTWGQQKIFILGLLTLLGIGGAGRQVESSVKLHGPALLAAAGCILLFSLVVVMPRYVAGPLVILGTVLSACIRLRRNSAPAWVTHFVCAAMVISLAWPTLAESAPALEQSGRDLRWRVNTTPNYAGQVALEARRAGIQPGDQVAHVGKALKNWSYWASVARVQIVAELRPAERFWEVSDEQRERALAVFREQTGVKALITKDPPAQATAQGWRRLGRTAHYVLMLQR